MWATAPPRRATPYTTAWGQRAAEAAAAAVQAEARAARRSNEPAQLDYRGAMYQSQAEAARQAALLGLARRVAAQRAQREAFQRLLAYAREATAAALARSRAAHGEEVLEAAGQGVDEGAMADLVHYLETGTRYNLPPGWQVLEPPPGPNQVRASLPALPACLPACLLACVQACGRSARRLAGRRGCPSARAVASPQPIHGSPPPQPRCRCARPPPPPLQPGLEERVNRRTGIRHVQPHYSREQARPACLPPSEGVLCAGCRRGPSAPCVARAALPTRGSASPCGAAAGVRGCRAQQRAHARRVRPAAGCPLDGRAAEPEP